jgi:hypothetical protein
MFPGLPIYLYITQLELQSDPDTFFAEEAFPEATASMRPMHGFGQQLGQVAAGAVVDAQYRVVPGLLRSSGTDTGVTDRVEHVWGRVQHRRQRLVGEYVEHQSVLRHGRADGVPDFVRRFPGCLIHLAPAVVTAPSTVFDSATPRATWSRLS